MDELGRPQRRRATAGRADFTATLQLATNATAYPAFGANGFITGTFDSNYGSETFVLDPVEYDETSAPGDIRKVSIKGWKKIQTTPLTAVA